MKKTGIIVSVLVILSLLLGGLSCTTSTPTPTPAPKPTPAPTTTSAPTAKPTSSPTLTPASSPAPTTAAPTLLRVGWPLAATHHLWVNAWLPMFKKIETRSNGRIKFEYYPAEALAKAADQYDATIKGLMDVSAQAWPAYMTGRVPLTALTMLLGVLPGDAYATSAVAESVFKSHLYKEWSATHTPTMALHGGYVLATKNKITKMEDLKGLKMRASGVTQVAPFEAFGAVPANIPSGDIYTSLQRGMIDGVFYAMGSFSSLRLEEVLNYITFPPFAWGGTTIIDVNLGVWNKLPKDIQTIFDEEAFNVKKAGIESYASEEKKVLANFQKAGKGVYELPPEELARWRGVMQGTAVKYVDDMEKKGIPAKAVYDEILKLSKSYK